MLTFETVISLDNIVELLKQRGLSVEVLLPLTSRQIPHDADIVRVIRGNRTMTVHAQAMNPLMFELLQPAVWCDGIAELLAFKDPPTHPDVVLADEAASWTSIP